MTKWEAIVTAHHKRAHPGDGFELFTKPGVAEKDLRSMEKRLGFQFPTELREFYSDLNGFGVRSAVSPDEVYWFIRPLEELPDFAETIRHWFQETHPDIASRFFPFVDWANGDGIGYLVDSTGEVLPGLVSFEHESYDFDEDQEVEEFLTTVPISIEEFLDSF